MTVVVNCGCSVHGNVSESVDISSAKAVTTVTVVVPLSGWSTGECTVSGVTGATSDRSPSKRRQLVLVTFEPGGIVLSNAYHRAGSIFIRVRPVEKLLPVLNSTAGSMRLLLSEFTKYTKYITFAK